MKNVRVHADARFPDFHRSKGHPADLVIYNIQYSYFPKFMVPSVPRIRSVNGQTFLIFRDPL